MRHIIHNPEWPKSIRVAYRDHPHPEDPTTVWEKFNKSEVRQNLWDIQSGLCAYCERTVKLDAGASAIEHIRPKGIYHEETFNYPNLVLCCADTHTCNLHKKSKYEDGIDVTGRRTEGFISPTQERCSTSFKYNGDGSIEPSPAAEKSDAEITLKILNLNYPPLKTERRTYFEAINCAIVSMEEQRDALEMYLEQEMALDNRKPFYSAKCQLYGNTTTFTTTTNQS
jgi:uncharacterized protein (TIGR02646 family)